MHAIISRSIVLSFVLMLSGPLPRASAQTVAGGGVVDGPLGVTSQLGFRAAADGGAFQCVMAGRSGGFPFGPWSEVLQMNVHGDVTPGTLTITDDGIVTFEGTATVQVVGRDADGRILREVFADVAYTTIHTEGGAGVATHELQLLGITFGPAALERGRIVIVP